MNHPSRCPCLYVISCVGLVWASAFRGEGQGLIQFNTRIPGYVDARVFNRDGVTPLTESYFAQLYAGAPGGGLAALGAPVQFRGGPASGYVSAGFVQVPGTPVGGMVNVKMVAWDPARGSTFEQATSLGLEDTGESLVITIQAGGFPFGVAGWPGPVQGDTEESGFPGEETDGPWPSHASVFVGAPPAGILVGLQGFSLRGGGGFVLTRGQPDTRSLTLVGGTGFLSCGKPVGAKNVVPFTAAESGQVTVTVQGKVIDAVVEVFEGHYLAGDNTSRVACTDEPDGPSVLLTFQAQASRAYWITVAAKDGTGGTEGIEYVLKGPVQGIQFGSLSAVYNGLPVSVPATATPGVQAVSVTYDGGAAPPVNAGSYTVVATVTDPGYYGSATNTLVIGRAPQGLTFVVPDRLYLGQTVRLQATADSMLPITYWADGGKTFLLGGSFRPQAAGMATLEARLDGDLNHLPASEKRSVPVLDPLPTLTLIRVGPGQLEVQVHGAPYARYAVERSDRLPAPPGAWETVMDMGADGGGSASGLLVQGAGVVRRYFRARWVVPET